MKSEDLIVNSIKKKLKALLYYSLLIFNYSLFTNLEYCMYIIINKTTFIVADTIMVIIKGRNNEY